MDQSGSASARPGADAKSVSALLKVGAVLLTAQVTTASAQEISLAGSAAGPVPIEISLLDQTATASSLAPQAPSHDLIQSPKTADQRASTRLAPAGRPTPKPARPDPAYGALRTADLGVTILLGSRGQPVPLTPVSQRWKRALSELEREGVSKEPLRHSLPAYAAILAKLKDQRKSLQIAQVNAMVNKLLRYREDSVLWNTGEYWASPVESLTRRAGDCEDYAILKYALLRDLGVKDKDMRLVALRDTAARQHHAVLSVRTSGSWMILDNRFSRVRFERDLPHYKALYSVNATGAWAHSTPRAGTPARLAARLHLLSQ